MQLRRYTITPCYGIGDLHKEDGMTFPKKGELLACSPKPTLAGRSLISSEDAMDLMSLFKVLANDTRLRLLHALARSGELCVSDLATSVEMKSQAVSNQLQRLVDRGILKSTRNGNNIYYRIIDPCTLNLLDQGMCLIEEARHRVHGGENKGVRRLKPNLRGGSTNGKEERKQTA